MGNGAMKDETIKLKHARSVKHYPDISLEEDEYVVLDMHRSPLGLIGIWSVVSLCIIVLSFCLIAFFGNEEITSKSFIQLNDTARGYLALIIVVIYAGIILGGVIGQVIYNANRMIVTNMRAIQKIRTSLFANSTNIIELKRIEDVSFRQGGIIDHILRMGVLRMSTVGSETTYTFPCLDTPKDEVEIISNLIHDLKTE